MDLAQGAIITGAVVLTFGYVATNARIDILIHFVHTFKPPIFSHFYGIIKTLCANFKKTIDILQIFLYNRREPEGSTYIK